MPAAQEAEPVSAALDRERARGWLPAYGGAVIWVLSRQAVDRDGDEEHDHDLADDPRVRAHPVSCLGKKACAR